MKNHRRAQPRPIGQVNLCLVLEVENVLCRARDDADDRERLGRLDVAAASRLDASAAERHRPAHRVVVGEQPPRERFADYRRRDAEDALVFVESESAPSEDGQAKRLEVAAETIV